MPWEILRISDGEEGFNFESGPSAWIPGGDHSNKFPRQLRRARFHHKVARKSGLYPFPGKSSPILMIIVSTIWRHRVYLCHLCDLLRLTLLCPFAGFAINFCRVCCACCRTRNRGPDRRPARSESEPSSSSLVRSSGNRRSATRARGSETGLDGNCTRPGRAP